MRKRIAFDVIPGIAVATAGVIVLSISVRTTEPHSSVKLWLEAEGAAEIVYCMKPCDDVSASGGRCIEIEQGAGTGIYGTGGGRATYDVDFPSMGAYTLWARVYWLDGCSNSFNVEFRGSTFHFGEDKIFNRWHWVGMVLPDVPAAGRERLTISNREDGVRIDELLITNDLAFIPQGIGGELICNDFNDGATAGWRPISSRRWHMARDGGIDGTTALYLDGAALPSNEYSMKEIGDKSSYRMSFVFKCGQEVSRKRHVRILFDYRSSADYRSVDIDGQNVSIEEVAGGRERTLAAAPTRSIEHFSLDNGFHTVELICGDRSVLLKYDALPVARASGIDIRGGTVGVGSMYGDIYFDDIVILDHPEINFSENFYYDDPRPVENTVGWTFEAGRWTRNMAFGTHNIGVGTEHVAAAIAGHRLWNNYSYEAAVKGDGSSAVGILFYCTDNMNTYLFRWSGSESAHGAGKEKQLVKVVGGRPEILAEQSGGYSADQWYRMKVEAADGRIRTYVDDRAVFDVFDNSLHRGKIGFWVDGAPAAPSADGISVHLWPGWYGGGAWEQQFPIQIERAPVRQGVYFCYRDPGNHYAMRWGGPGGDGSSIELVESLGGVERILDRRENMLAYALPYTVEVGGRDGSIHVCILGMMTDRVGDLRRKELVRFDIDSPRLDGGRIGLLTGRKINAVFDDVLVTNSSGYRDDFGLGESRSLLSWDVVGGAWEVERGALRPTSGSPAKAIIGNGEWKNGRFRFEVNPGDRGTGSFGAFVRYLDEENHYRLTVDARRGESTATLYRARGGEESVLAGTTVNPDPGAGYGLDLELDDGWIGIRLGDSLILDAWDETIPRGRTGLFADASGGISFDDITIGIEPDDRDLIKVSTGFSGTGTSAHGADSYDGWSITGNSWSIERGAMNIGNAEGPVYMWREDAAFFDDVSIEMDVSAVERGGSDVGLIIGGVRNGYLFRIDEAGCRLIGNGEPSATAPRPVLNPGRTFRLCFAYRHGRFICRVDGGNVLQLEEKVPQYGGKIGIVTESGGIRIDNLLIRTYPARFYGFSMAKWAAKDASHWKKVSGRWDEAGSISYALFGEPDETGEAVVFHERELPDDIAVEMRIALHPCGEDGGFALLFPATEPGTAGAPAVEFEYETDRRSGTARFGRIRAFLREGGDTAEGQLMVPGNRGWIAVRVERRGKTIKAYIENTELLRHSCERPIPRGTIGIKVSGGRASPLFFEDIAIYDLGETSIAPW